MAVEHRWKILLLTNMSPVTLSVTDGVGGCKYLISVNAIRIYAPL